MSETKFNEAVMITRDEFFHDITHFWTEFNQFFKDDPGMVSETIWCIINTPVIKKYTYKVNNGFFNVYDSSYYKLTIASDESYHCFFNKVNGTNIRFGKHLIDDPTYCPLGPEILDLEISVNGCVPVPGSANCRYCYKNNTNAKPTNMSLATFQILLSRFPKNLSQVAFGITGLNTNPDMEAMFAYCRRKGIIPNVTTVGADLDEHNLDVLCKYCGAVAVSCYTNAKELCYKNIALIHKHAKEKYGRELHVNMHIVISKDNMSHLKDVLKDIKEKKVEGLKSVVLLRIKPKGRAQHMDCTLSHNDYKEIISYCIDNDISFGFDSCSAIPVMEVLKELDKAEYCTSVEPCESSKLSSYINVHGQYWSCSFAEGTDFIKPINVLDYPNILDWWNGPELQRIRNYDTPACKSCPIYNLDGMK